MPIHESLLLVTHHFSVHFLLNISVFSRVTCRDCPFLEETCGLWFHIYWEINFFLVHNVMLLLTPRNWHAVNLPFVFTGEEQSALLKATQENQSSQSKSSREATNICCTFKQPMCGHSKQNVNRMQDIDLF